jgi:ERCC4-type nuclease
MTLIDSAEKPYVFEAFDLMGISYMKKDIRLWVCKECDKVSINPFECCGEVESEKVADIVGDNWNYAIERKKEGDLVSSLDGRLYEQLEKLSTYFKGCVALVFEGDLEELCNNENYASRAGQIRSIPATCMQYGVSFIQVKDITALCKLIKYFEYKCGTEPKVRSKRHRINKALPKTLRLYKSIEGVGPKLGMEIYSHYKYPIEFAIALMNGTDVKIKGLGPKGRENIKEWFGIES